MTLLPQAIGSPFSPNFQLKPTKKFAVFHPITYSEQNEENLNEENLSSYSLSYLEQKPLPVHIRVNYDCKYTHKIISEAVKKRDWCHLVDRHDSIEELINEDSSYTLQICDFEHTEWENVMQNKCGASSFIVRKGLSRKAQLANRLIQYIAKKNYIYEQKTKNLTPEEISSSNIRPCYMSAALPKSIIIDTWSAESQSTSLNFGIGGGNIDFNMPAISNANLRMKISWILEENGSKELIEKSKEKIVVIS